MLCVLGIMMALHNLVVFVVFYPCLTQSPSVSYMVPSRHYAAWGRRRRFLQQARCRLVPAPQATLVERTEPLPDDRGCRSEFLQGVYC